MTLKKKIIINNIYYSGNSLIASQLKFKHVNLADQT